MGQFLSDLIVLESQRLKGWVYCNIPYPCSLSEALPSFKAPVPDGMIINRLENLTEFILKPLKGSRRRKKLIVKVWGGG